jgi:aspartyl-tRNA(Asn)/glutamyl-tRNA(Gln) amidotransferase subunit B
MVGQIMKVSKGQANPQLVNKILKERLDNLWLKKYYMVKL